MFQQTNILRKCVVENYVSFLQDLFAVCKLTESHYFTSESLTLANANRETNKQTNKLVSEKFHNLQQNLDDKKKKKRWNLIDVPLKSWHKKQIELYLLIYCCKTPNLPAWDFISYQLLNAQRNYNFLLIFLLVQNNNHFFRDFTKQLVVVLVTCQNTTLSAFQNDW